MFICCLIQPAIAVGIIFAPLLVQLVLAVSGGAGVGRQIANAQIIFNMIGVVVVIAFLPIIVSFLQRLIPDTAGDRRLQPEAVQAAK